MIVRVTHSFPVEAKLKAYSNINNGLKIGMGFESYKKNINDTRANLIIPRIVIIKRLPEKYAGQHKLLFLKALEILNKNMLKRKKSHRRVASNWLSKFKICLLRAPKKILKPKPGPFLALLKKLKKCSNKTNRYSGVEHTLSSMHAARFPCLATEGMKIHCSNTLYCCQKKQKFILRKC
ncbi:uncharacterized protein EV154DRAFT_488849 [Mucor mucedo]|uniref:uncharacterized protein n=1 Tax=Mucor mucedo TaxID=29922 RepID=UPI00221F30BB|nr:uncharacterized protein EV154DRAFT_488849 [Mucor mucedo]KAI7864719.1 hypothetical protein EV154DRAFT_488849 [Mucor mucedo]